MYGFIRKAAPALAVIAALAAPSTSAAVKCASSIHLIAARGQGPGSDWNVLTELRDAMLKAIPGSTAEPLPYDHGDSNKPEAVHTGAILMQEYIYKYHNTCPDAKIAIFGYSLGAVVAMEAVCGTSSLGLVPTTAIASNWTSAVIGVIAYGDETYVPGMPWNAGNCTTGIGEFPRLGSMPTCDDWAPAIQSYCDTGDYACCAGSSIPSLKGTNPVHHTYFRDYDSAVIKFLKKRLVDTA